MKVIEPYQYVRCLGYIVRILSGHTLVVMMLQYVCTTCTVVLRVVKVDEAYHAADIPTPEAGILRKLHTIRYEAL
jgi:hypothetical protein